MMHPASGYDCNGRGPNAEEPSDFEKTTRLLENWERLDDALREVMNYLESQADAEVVGDHWKPNEAMRLSMALQEAMTRAGL